MTTFLALLALHLPLANPPSSLRPASAAPAAALKDVLSAWKARQDRVASVKFAWTESHIRKQGSRMSAHTPKEINPTGKDDPPHDERYTEVATLLLGESGWFRYHAIRREGRDPDGKLWQDSESTYDGSAVQKLSLPNERLDFPRPSGNYPKFERFIDPYMLQLVPLMTAYRPFDSVFGRFKTEGLRIVEGDFGHEGRACVVVESIPKDKQQGVEQWWTDPTREYIIVKHIDTDQFGQRNFETAITHKHDPKWGWVPSTWQTKLLYPHGSIRSAWSSRVTATEFGLPLMQKDFQIVFPPETYIRDSRGETEISYTLDANGKRTPPKPEK